MMLYPLGRKAGAGAHKLERPGGPGGHGHMGALLQLTGPHKPSKTLFSLAKKHGVCMKTSMFHGLEDV